MTTSAASGTLKSSVRKKRDIVRARVLDAAALQMNLQGATSVDLNSVSSAVGLSRNALYHYFKNRRELVYHCYLRANSELARDLDQASSAERSASEQLQLLVSANLAEDRPDHAVLHYVDALEPAEQDAINRLRRQNVRGVESILEGGVQRGEFRQVNTSIAAQVLLGIMDWAQLWYIGAGERAHTAARRRAASAPFITDILLGGLAVDRSFALTNPPELISVTARNFNAFDIQDISDEKRLQLIGTASRLFNQRGIEATSIDDVAAAVGATKGAVYHYFENKNQLLMACYERAFDLYDRFIEAAEKRNGGAIDVLMAIMHVNCQAQADRHPPLMMQSDPFSLPARYAQRVRAISRRVQKMRKIAVKQGLCRIDDPAVLDLSAGASFWVQKWLMENQSFSPRLLADEVCSIYSRGISV